MLENSQSSTCKIFEYLIQFSAIIEEHQVCVKCIGFDWTLLWKVYWMQHALLRNPAELSKLKLPASWFAIKWQTGLHCFLLLRCWWLIACPASVWCDTKVEQGFIFAKSEVQTWKQLDWETSPEKSSCMAFINYYFSRVRDIYFAFASKRRSSFGYLWNPADSLFLCRGLESCQSHKGIPWPV